LGLPVTTLFRGWQTPWIPLDFPMKTNPLMNLLLKPVVARGADPSRIYMFIDGLTMVFQHIVEHPGNRIHQNSLY
jgi:hypothetical protein